MFGKIATLFLAVLFLASAHARAAEIKIGVIDMQRALNETQEGKKALEKLKLKLDAENHTMKSRQEELKKMEDELSQKGYMMSESARAEKQEVFKRQLRDFEKYREDKGREFMGLQKEATEKILKKLMERVKEYAKTEGFTVILESSSQTVGMPGSVVWYENKLDVTSKIVEIYDKFNKTE